MGDAGDLHGAGRRDGWPRPADGSRSASLHRVAITAPTLLRPVGCLQCRPLIVGETVPLWHPSVGGCERLPDRGPLEAQIGPDGLVVGKPPLQVRQG